jgi:hypothetical protein
VPSARGAGPEPELDADDGPVTNGYSTPNDLARYLAALPQMEWVSAAGPLRRYVDSRGSLSGGGPGGECNHEVGAERGGNSFEDADSGDGSTGFES